MADKGGKRNERKMRVEPQTNYGEGLVVSASRDFITDVDFEALGVSREQVMGRDGFNVRGLELALIQYKREVQKKGEDLAKSSVVYKFDRLLSMLGLTPDDSIVPEQQPKEFSKGIMEKLRDKKPSEIIAEYNGRIADKYIVPVINDKAPYIQKDRWIRDLGDNTFVEIDKNGATVSKPVMYFFNQVERIRKTIQKHLGLHAIKQEDIDKADWSQAFLAELEKQQPQQPKPQQKPKQQPIPQKQTPNQDPSQESQVPPHLRRPLPQYKDPSHPPKPQQPTQSQDPSRPPQQQQHASNQNPKRYETIKRADLLAIGLTDEQIRNGDIQVLEKALNDYLKPIQLYGQKTTPLYERLHRFAMVIGEQEGRSVRLHSNPMGAGAMKDYRDLNITGIVNEYSRRVAETNFVLDFNQPMQQHSVQEPESPVQPVSQQSIQPQPRFAQSPQPVQQQRSYQMPLGHLIAHQYGEELLRANGDLENLAKFAEMGRGGEPKQPYFLGYRNRFCVLQKLPAEEGIARNVWLVITGEKGKENYRTEKVYMQLSEKHLDPMNPHYEQYAQHLVLDTFTENGLDNIVQGRNGYGGWDVLDSRRGKVSTVIGHDAKEYSHIVKSRNAMAQYAVNSARGTLANDLTRYDRVIAAQDGTQLGINYMGRDDNGIQRYSVTTTINGQLKTDVVYGNLQMGRLGLNGNQEFTAQAGTEILGVMTDRGTGPKYLEIAQTKDGLTRTNVHTERDVAVKQDPEGVCFDWQVTDKDGRNFYIRQINNKIVHAGKEMSKDVREKMASTQFRIASTDRKKWRSQFRKQLREDAQLSQYEIALEGRDGAIERRQVYGYIDPAIMEKKKGRDYIANKFLGSQGRADGVDRMAIDQLGGYVGTASYTFLDGYHTEGKKKIMKFLTGLRKERNRMRERETAEQMRRHDREDGGQFEH